MSLTKSMWRSGKWCSAPKGKAFYFIAPFEIKSSLRIVCRKIEQVGIGAYMTKEQMLVLLPRHNLYAKRGAYLSIGWNGTMELLPEKEAIQSAMNDMLREEWYGKARGL